MPCRPSLLQDSFTIIANVAWTVCGLVPRAVRAVLSFWIVSVARSRKPYHWSHAWQVVLKERPGHNLTRGKQILAGHSFHPSFAIFFITVSLMLGRSSGLYAANNLQNQIANGTEPFCGKPIGISKLPWYDMNWTGTQWTTMHYVLEFWQDSVFGDSALRSNESWS